MEMKCYICKAAFKKIEEFVFHYKIAHSVNYFRKDKIQCVFPECESSFSNMENLKRHLRNFHPIPCSSKDDCTGFPRVSEPESIEIDEASEVRGGNPSPNSSFRGNEENTYSENFDDHEMISDESSDVSHHTEDGDETGRKGIDENIPLTYIDSLMKLLNDLGIAEKDISKIMEACSFINESTFDIIKHVVAKEGSSEIKQNIDRLSDRLRLKYDIASSAYRRRQLLSKMEYFVLPNCIGLQIDINSLQPKQSKFAYIPILQTLEKILKNDDLFKVIFKQRQVLNPHDVLENYQDGTNFKNNVHLNDNEYNLFIQVYFDEFQFAKQSRSKNEKIGI
ncbi:uncharacterized protein LOC129806751 [Phlebotomus papatasi]|uniref:uncharacterized protein LOC129806751 n=1 Tax=Phlebotomus papatasi TaxID=29031 RepID=UPI0024841025|nr:uncharacterized protein LOC129806751 [Phlebotomus papatasi]